MGCKRKKLSLRAGLHQRHAEGHQYVNAAGEYLPTSAQPEYCNVNDSLGWISEKLKVKPDGALTQPAASVGWIGRQPVHFFSTSAKVRAPGMEPIAHHPPGCRANRRIPASQSLAI